MNPMAEHIRFENETHCIDVNLTSSTIPTPTEKPYLFVTFENMASGLTLKLLNSDTVKTGFYHKAKESLVFDTKGQIWGSPSWYVKENNTDIPYYNGNLQITNDKLSLKEMMTHYNLEALIQEMNALPTPIKTNTNKNKIKPVGTTPLGTKLGGTIQNTIRKGNLNQLLAVVKKSIPNDKLDNLEEVIKAINQSFLFPGPNLINQPSDHLCIKLTLEYMPDMKLDLSKVPYTPSTGSLIGSYNMSFANIIDVVKHNMGHFSSEATFLSKNDRKEGMKLYRDNALENLSEFMALKPLAVSLQEMVVYSFQDETAGPSLKQKQTMEIESLHRTQTIRKDFAWKDKNNQDILYPIQYWPGKTLDITRETMDRTQEPFQEIYSNYLIDLIGKFCNDYYITYGTVLANQIGESAVLLTHRSAGVVQHPRIYNIGHNTAEEKDGKPILNGMDARPLLIATLQNETTGNVLLVNIHAPNKPQVPDPVGYIKGKILHCIKQYLQEFPQTLKDCYMMGDFNDKLNELKGFEFEGLSIQYGSAPVSCCYNWNSSSYMEVPRPLKELQLEENNANMTKDRKECIEEFSGLYQKFTHTISHKLLKSVGTQTYLFGMPLMREQGNLLNYLFTGDYCFSDKNQKPIKIFRNLHVNLSQVTFPAIPEHEKYNFLLEVYRNKETDPETRKKIYYTLNVDSTESDHEMVYLEIAGTTGGQSRKSRRISRRVKRKGKTKRRIAKSRKIKN